MVDQAVLIDVTAGATEADDDNSAAPDGATDAAAANNSAAIVWGCTWGLWQLPVGPAAEFRCTTSSLPSLALPPSPLRAHEHTL
jgi:hypothetical protein